MIEAVSLFDMLEPREPKGAPVEDTGPCWTRRDSRNWDAALRFMGQHPELFPPAEDYRDYLPYWEPERPNYYVGWDY